MVLGASPLAEGGLGGGGRAVIDNPARIGEKERMHQLVPPPGERRVRPVLDACA